MRKIASLFTMLMLLSALAFGQNRTISGTVTDEKGDILPGASVRLKGTRTGTQTGADGSYSISAPSSATTVVITSVGYAPQEIAIGTGNANVSLQPISGTLNDVVVIGYGSVRKKDLTGSVAPCSSQSR